MISKSNDFYSQVDDYHPVSTMITNTIYGFIINTQWVFYSLIDTVSLSWVNSGDNYLSFNSTAAIQVPKMPMVITVGNGITLIDVSEFVNFTDCHPSCVTCKTLYRRENECLSCRPKMIRGFDNTCFGSC